MSEDDRPTVVSQLYEACENALAFIEDASAYLPTTMDGRAHNVICGIGEAMDRADKESPE